MSSAVNHGSLAGVFVAHEAEFRFGCNPIRWLFGRPAYAIITYEFHAGGRFSRRATVDDGENERHDTDLLTALCHPLAWLWVREFVVEKGDAGPGKVLPFKQWMLLHVAMQNVFDEEPDDSIEARRYNKYRQVQMLKIEWAEKHGVPA